MINQGLFYLDWLLDHKADYKLLVMEKLGIEEAEKIDWSVPYKARMANTRAMKKKADRHVYVGEMAPTEWWCYSNPYDFD